MEISKHKFISAILLTVLITSVIAVAAQSALIYFHKDPRVVANVYFYEENNGISRLIAESGNLITDLGENRTLLALNGTATSILWIAVGNETAVAKTDSGLTTEATTVGFGRVACNVSAAWMNSDDYSLNYTASFDASALISVNSAILCWSATPSENNTITILVYVSSWRFSPCVAYPTAIINTITNETQATLTNATGYANYTRMPTGHYKASAIINSLGPPPMTLELQSPYSVLLSQEKDATEDPTIFELSYTFLNDLNISVYLMGEVSIPIWLLIVIITAVLVALYYLTGEVKAKKVKQK